MRAGGRPGQPRIVTGVAVTNNGLRLPNRRQVRIAEDQKLFVYGRNPQTGQLEILDRDYRKVKDQLLNALTNFGNPIIRTFTRRMASNAFRSLACLLYGYNFRYLNGMKMYRLWAFQGIEVKSGGFAYNAELVAKAILRNPNLRIGEAPFVARGRAAGSTTAFKPKAILRAVRELNRGVQSVHEYRLAVIRAEDS